MALKDDWYQARVQRQNEVKEIHQTGLADKQQRQTENAERRRYVWGDQAETVSLPKSKIAQPMASLD